MKKVILLPALVFIASCSLLQTPRDFQAYYQDSMTSSFRSLQDLSDMLGIGHPYAVDGSLHLAGSLPGVMSGTLDTNYLVKSAGRDADLRLSKFLTKMETLFESGALSIDDLQMIVKNGDTFLQWKGVDGVSFVDTVMRETLTRYEWVWYAFTKDAVMKTLESSNPDEYLSYQVSDMLSQMTLADFEEYLKKYQLLKSLGDRGVQDGVQRYQVELDQKALSELMIAFAERVTGTGISLDTQTRVREEMSSVMMTGMIGFDTRTAQVQSFSGRISDTNASGSLDIGYQKSENTLDISLTSEVGGVIVNFVRDPGEQKYTNTIKILEGATEKVLITTHLMLDGKRIEHADMLLQAEGMRATIEHSEYIPGAFTGMLDVGVGSMKWSGATEKDHLTALAIEWATFGNAFRLQMNEGKDGFITGPLTLRSGEEVVLEATGSLLAAPERFALLLDLIMPQTPELATHLEFDTRYKKSAWKGMIEAPTVTKPLQDLVRELEASTYPTSSGSSPEAFIEQTTP